MIGLIPLIKWKISGIKEIILYFKLLIIDENLKKEEIIGKRRALIDILSNLLR